MRSLSCGKRLAFHLWLLITPLGALYSQSQVTSIVTTGSIAPTVTYNNVKGAGLRKADNTLRSSWDSTGTNFTVKFNATALSNIKSVTQYFVSSLASTVIRMPANAIVKLRRLANSYVTDTRNHYNFWTTYSSVPAAGATSGTFNFTAPEVLSPEDAFLLNNITSGYDNIFENTITNLHASNIERLDFIIPTGLKAYSDTDRTNSGVAVFDRGNGDPFKIAAVTAINGSGDPTAYGTLVPVTAANFGNTLLPTSFDFCIITKDPKYYNESRPSSPDNQNLRGVFISLADLGLAVNQTFYGYSMFGNDVVTANPDWTTYPANTSTTSGLDPVNIMGLYKTTFSVLAVPLGFSATRTGNTAKLNFTVFNKISNDHVIAERSTDGLNYTVIGRIDLTGTGEYSFTDRDPAPGNNFYRLKLAEKDGTMGYTEIRKLSFPVSQAIKIYPNPASTVLHITIPGAWQQKKINAELIDVTGKVLLRRTIERAGVVETFFVKKYPRGYYTLRLINTGDQRIHSQRLLLGNE